MEARELTEIIFQNLSNKLEDLLIEGLRLKGFEFENKMQLEVFVKEYCTCIDNLEHKERIYSVNGDPFFFHNYEIIYEPITEINKELQMNANYGRYAFL
jgi:predicted ribosome-associated RNA-binding protein Tma20